jgi:hypothetical protein
LEAGFLRRRLSVGLAALAVQSEEELPSMAATDFIHPTSVARIPQVNDCFAFWGEAFFARVLDMMLPFR